MLCLYLEEFKGIEPIFPLLSPHSSVYMCSHAMKTNAVQKKVEGYAHENAVWIKTPLNPKCIFKFASVQKSSMKIKNVSPSQQHNSKTHVADILLETKFLWENRIE